MIFFLWLVYVLLFRYIFAVFYFSLNHNVGGAAFFRLYVSSYHLNYSQTFILLVVYIFISAYKHINICFYTETIMADVSCPPPIRTDFYKSQSVLGWSQPFIRHRAGLEQLSRLIEAISHFVAPIGCRSVQLYPKALWSVPVDMVLWKLVTNWKILHWYVLEIWSGVAR